MSSSAERRPLLVGASPSRAQIPHVDVPDTGADLPTASPGVARAAVISSHLTPARRFVLFFCIFLVGFAYSIESLLRLAYLPLATSSFDVHSSLSTINVLRSVVSVAAMPTASKLADVFGRLEVVAAATALYAVGIVIESTAQVVEVYYVGSVVYQLGYTTIALMMEVLIADFSSMRARVVYSYIPAIPFFFSIWIVGAIIDNIYQDEQSWRLGIGMWAGIFPACTAPLLITLWSIERSARRDGLVEDYKTPMQLLGVREVVSQLFHQLDVMGLVFLVGSFAFILAPLTKAGGTVSHFSDPAIVTSLAFGLFCVPCFIVWERNRARAPLVPFHLLTDRGVWAALMIRSLLNFAWYMQGNYLVTVLTVAFDFAMDTSLRIASFYSVFGVACGMVTGFIIYKIRRLKYVIVLGTIIFSLAFVLLIEYPGGASYEARSGVISAQVLLGLAGGLFAYPTQASIQASASREQVALLTGLYMSFYNVGSALGTCLSGGIWTQTLYPLLKRNLAFQPDADLAQKVYENPFRYVGTYPPETDIRDAIIESYQSVQKMLCITGLCICLPMIAFAFALRDPRLSTKSVQQDDRDDENDEA